MKIKGLLLIFVMLFAACKQGQKLESKNGFTVLPEVAEGEAVATYAGGCFWAMQECMIELKGVNKVVSGYAGGATKDPTYEKVLGKATGHAESVLVYYDPKVISFERLTAAFFNAHDPKQVNRQGPDVGSDYRSIAFYRSENEMTIIRNAISRLDSLNGYVKPVATEVLPFEAFYPAESDHQDYYKRNFWDFYIRNVSKPKVMKLRKLMPQLIKAEYAE
ncbi:MAG TPA: peptide-methionine (S)-S-oxide reductase MsrA [Pedobacter sp.]|nr:peptide-methionine (S)-S-oxide reductase MsrA [Pedobacter sp.]